MPSFVDSAYELARPDVRRVRGRLTERRCEAVGGYLLTEMAADRAINNRCRVALNIWHTMQLRDGERRSVALR